MNAVKKWTLPIAVLAIIGVLFVWRMQSNAAAEAELEAQAGQRPLAAVETTVAGPATLRSTLNAVGSVESPFRVELSPKTAGRINYLNVREGDAVKKGQVLVKIDPAEAQAQVTSAQAAVAEARARLAEAQLEEGPSRASVEGEAQREEANLSAANAALGQVRQSANAQIATAQSQVDDANARVSSAKAQTANAQAAVDREQATLKNAQTRYNRVKSLYDQGFIAAQDVDDAQTAVDVARSDVQVAQAQLQAAQDAVRSAEAQANASRQNLSIVRERTTADLAAANATVRQAQAGVNVAQANRNLNPAYKENLAALNSIVRAAEAQLAQARTRLTDTTLVAPMDGVITARTGDVGSLASPGQPVLVVQSLDWVFFEASLPVEQASLVNVGEGVSVTVDGIETAFNGTVTNVNPAASDQNRQFTLMVRLPNPDGRLKPGMFGKVSIVSREVNALVAVPRESVTSPETEPKVTVIGDDGTASVRSVTTGATDGTLIEIIDGVEPGEKVVVVSFRPVRDGDKVQTEATDAN